MAAFVPRALATGIGSLPHPDASSALRVILKNFPCIPYWPQLTRRDFRENMYVQFSEGLAGVKLDIAREYIGVEIGQESMGQAEAFYARYLEEDPGLFAIGRDYARGLFALAEEGVALDSLQWIKGQVTGPISFGLRVTDQNLRPVLYDETLRDVLVKHLVRKAQWEESYLSGIGSTLIFVDEPSLALIGASMVALNRDEVVRDLEEVLGGLKGLKGTHCCGNTDWSLLLQTSVDVISFDAYNYAENLALFTGDVKAFLDRGGVIAWGIVPTAEDEIMRTSEEELVKRLDSAMGLLVNKGLDRGLVYQQALITPACGLGTISVPAAERALMLTHKVSRRVRDREWAFQSE